MIRSAATLSALGALVFAASPAAAQPCSAQASLDGDPAAVASVTTELARLGVTVVPPDARPAVGCKRVTATVELGRDGGIAVAVKTGAQSEGRTVSDATLAATWIDSWLQDELGGPAFTAELAQAPLANPAPMHDEPPDEAPARSVFDRFAIDAALAQSWTGEGGHWNGVSAGACGQFGALCFGARGRYATQDLFTGQTAAERSDLAVLATASYVKKLGRVTLGPELGLGFGRTVTRRVDGCRAVTTCDPSSAGCTVPPTMPECVEHDPVHAYALDFNDHFRASTITPRASGAVRLEVPLAAHVWLDGIASVMLSPFEHGDRFALPATTPHPFGVPDEQLALPGESLATFELGIGLRVGAP